MNAVPRTARREKFMSSFLSSWHIGACGTIFTLSQQVRHVHDIVRADCTYFYFGDLKAVRVSSVPEPSFVDLYARLDAGDEMAAAELFQRYSQQLIRLATPRLKGLVRQKVDPEDIVQSALGSFFRVNAQGGFSLSGWNDLWSVLVTITLRKCRYQVRHFLTVKRDIRREEGAVQAAELDGFRVLAPSPTPIEAAELADLINHLLTGLDTRSRQVAELCLENRTPAEIGPCVGLTERSVYRILDRIRGRLEQLDQAVQG